MPDYSARPPHDLPSRRALRGSHGGQALHCREGLGATTSSPGQRGRSRPGPALHRPPPAPRGHQPAGLRGAAPGGPPAAPPGPDDRHRGPQHAHAGHRQAASRTPRPASRSRRCAPTAEEFGVRLHSAGGRRAGHRARGGPAAGPHPARDDRGLRRLPHLHPRRLRRPGLRHRHLRGRARAGHPDAAAEAVQDHGHHRRGHAAPGRHRQGHHPGRDRQDRHRRRAGLRARSTAAAPSASCPWRRG